MRVRVKLFASYAEAAGTDELDIALPDGATAADCLAAIRRQPWAARLPPSPALAINRRYARPDAPVREGDELAVVPPVAGG